MKPPPPMSWPALIAAIWVGCSFPAGLIAAARGRSFGIGFCLGLLLGPLGLVLAWRLEKRPPP